MEIWTVKDEITGGEYNYTLEDFVKAGAGEKISTSDPDFYVKSMQRAREELARLRKDSEDLKEAVLLLREAYHIGNHSGVLICYSLPPELLNKIREFVIPMPIEKSDWYRIQNAMKGQNEQSSTVN